jgi:murein DD-endopeptidase MepM/ murein hydrolase activator NlpD
MRLPVKLALIASLLTSLLINTTPHIAMADLPAPAAIEPEAAPPVTENRLEFGPGTRPSRWWQRTRLWRMSSQVAHDNAMLLPMSGHLSRGYRAGEWHYGLDIAASRNSPIVAARAGEVIFSGWDNTGYGRMVQLDHGDGVRTLYAHLQTALVKRGQRVPAGYLIGLSGNTGNSLGPHLHFEISKDGVKLDPLAFYTHTFQLPASPSS